MVAANLSTTSNAMKKRICSSGPQSLEKSPGRPAKRLNLPGAQRPRQA